MVGHCKKGKKNKDIQITSFQIPSYGNLGFAAGVPCRRVQNTPSFFPHMCRRVDQLHILDICIPALLGIPLIMKMKNPPAHIKPRARFHLYLNDQVPTINFTNHLGCIHKFFSHHQVSQISPPFLVTLKKKPIAHRLGQRIHRQTSC